MVLVFHDVGEQRRLEDMLRQSQKMDAMGQLAGGVAHDFNNMLAGILGFAELLAARLAGHDEEERLAKRIVRTADRAAGLTRQLLAFSRKGRLVSRNMDLHRVLEDTIGILRRTIDPRIEISTDLAAEHTVVTGDSALVENALLNLSLNARDAMPEGGRLSLATRNQDIAPSDPLLVNFNIPAGSYLRISITDTGVGMPPEVLAKLFMPFFTTKERGKGTGLGLAAVYGIARDHHGAVTAESTPGQGSTFHLYLPLANEQTAVETGLFQRPRLGSGCVLVIDDEPAVRDMVTVVLQDLGYEVLQAVDGPTGLDVFALERGRIGLVILDLVMPRMHGRDVFVHLRQIDREVPVLLTSGYTQDANLEELISQPHVDFIQKPYRIPELGQRVAEMIRAE
jgi:nitrogen-specific signal transduction histidine kinase/CheY-like chemotaxis protein